MVLVSHRYKFIFLKNRKTGSSSIEAFWGQYCVSEKDQKKWEITEKINEKISKYGIVGGRHNHGNANKKGYYSHMSAKQLKRKIGSEIFDSYIKVSVIRNPWDYIVSKYHWNNRKIGKKGFKSFVKKQNHKLYWKVHTIKGKPICDVYLRYENLYQDLAKFLDKIGIKNYDLSKIPHYKSNIRPKGKKYVDYYDKETRKIVAKKFRRTIKKFNYKY